MASGDPRGLVIWMTGLPCAGKSTLAAALARELAARRRRVEVLDGDLLRPYLSAELGYSRADRDVNVCRIGFVAQLLARHGVFVVVAAVSPFEAARREVRRRIEYFFEIHVDCPLYECERRDVKGMYALARAGKIKDFTGIDSPYEPPSSAELRVSTLETTVEESVTAILSALEENARL